MTAKLLLRANWRRVVQYKLLMLLIICITLVLNEWTAFTVVVLSNRCSKY